MTRLIPERIDDAMHAVEKLGFANIAWTVGLAAAAFVVGRFVAWVLVRSAKRWARKSTTVADDLVVEHLPAPLRVLIPALAVNWTLPWLPLQSKPFDHFVLVVIIASVGWTAFRLLLVVEEHFARRYDVAKVQDLHARRRFTQLRAFRNIGGFIVVLVTSSFALMTFDTVRNIGTGLLASAGVAGIVIGFAAQKTIATLLAGVQIAVAQPIRVGDSVLVEGEFGTIEEIALTYVVLRVWDLRRLVVPVQYFIDKPFQNWTRGETSLLGTVELKLDFSVSIDAIREELGRVLEASPRWNKKQSSVQVTDASERTMVVRMLVSAKNAEDLWDLRCEVREKLITFVHTKYPGGLPRVRTENAERRAA